MTERKLYRCDICEVEYATPKDAQECEQYHIAPMSGAKKYCKCLYKGMRQGGCDQYPYKMVITMSDGKQIEYRR